MPRGRQRRRRQQENAEAKVDRDWTYVYAYVFVPLYERQVAKPLSICNPDRDAFASRFTDGVRSSRRTGKRERERERSGREKKKHIHANERIKEREREVGLPLSTSLYRCPIKNERSNRRER